MSTASFSFFGDAIGGLFVLEVSLSNSNLQQCLMLVALVTSSSIASKDSRFLDLSFRILRRRTRWYCCKVLHVWLQWHGFLDFVYLTSLLTLRPKGFRMQDLIDGSLNPDPLCTKFYAREKSFLRRRFSTTLEHLQWSAKDTNPLRIPDFLRYSVVVDLIWLSSLLDYAWVVSNSDFKVQIRSVIFQIC